MKKLTYILIAACLLTLASQTASADTLYDFSDSSEPWVAECWEWGAPVLRWSSEHEGSLEIDTSAVEVNEDNWAKFFIKADKTFDLSGNSYLSVDIYVPKECYYCKAKIVVRTGGGWTAYESKEYKLENNNTWQNITYKLSNVDNLSDVRQVGVELQGFMSEVPTLYIKNISAK